MPTPEEFLQARFAVRSLVEQPDELINYLSGRPSKLENVKNEATIAALGCIKKFYRNLKREITVNDGVLVDKSDCLKLLPHEKNETCDQLVNRHIEKYLGIDKQSRKKRGKHKKKKEKKVKTPEELSEDSDETLNESSVTITMSEVEENDQPCSSSSSRSGSSKENAKPRSKKARKTKSKGISPIIWEKSAEEDNIPLGDGEDRRTSANMVEHVDRSCSPIGEDELGYGRRGFHTPASVERRELREMEGRRLEVHSIEVQTEMERIDAYTITSHQSLQASLQGTPNSSEFSSSKTSSSIVSSENSVGQISLRRIIETRRKFNLVTVGMDGSVHANGPSHMGTPIMGGVRRRISERMSNDSARTRIVEPNLNLQLQSHTESPLVAPEESIRSDSERRPRVFEIDQDEDNIEQAIERQLEEMRVSSKEDDDEDVSTLNQISPLPTTG